MIRGAHLLFVACGVAALALAAADESTTFIPNPDAETLPLSPRDYLQKFNAEMKKRQSKAKDDSGLTLQPRDLQQNIEAASEQHSQDSDSKMSESPCTKKLTKVTLSAGEYAIITSKDYPSTYPAKSKCKWKFVPAEGSYLTVYCTAFDLEPKTRKGKCSDVLKIGKDKFCGNEGPSGVWSYEPLFIQFKANKKKPYYTGFYCYVDAFSDSYSTTTPYPYPYSSTDSPNPGSTKQPPKPGSTSEPGSVKCGVPNRVSRIVGGVETTVNEYPWQAAMVQKGTSSSFCGGSVISTKYILTAAHCTQAVKDYNIDYEILVGAHCLSSPASSQMRIKPQKYIQHSQYNDNTMDTDISIIVLKTAINFENSEIRPVCLPPKSAGDFNSDVATVSGWGALKENGNGPDCLNEVDVPVITNTKCQKQNSQASITSNMICAGYDKGKKDSCQGDSGGPLFLNSGCGYEQIGVVSFGFGCARPKLPGVYVRVTEYIDWIKSKLGNYPTYSCR